jgi:hypothetical protein
MGHCNVLSGDDDVDDSTGGVWELAEDIGPFARSWGGAVVVVASAGGFRTSPFQVAASPKRCLEAERKGKVAVEASDGCSEGPLVVFVLVLVVVAGGEHSVKHPVGGVMPCVRLEGSASSLHNAAAAPGSNNDDSAEPASLCNGSRVSVFFSSSLSVTEQEVSSNSLLSHVVVVGECFSCRGTIIVPVAVLVLPKHWCCFDCGDSCC